MNHTTIHIKNMVCQSCIKVVADELKSLGLQVIDVKLGKAIYGYSASLPIETIADVLEKNGFEIILKREEKLVELIKLTLLDVINNRPDILSEEKVFIHLAEVIGKPYPYLSKAFSRNKKITIERYFILQKIEKAKEFLEYEELTFSEIAYRLGYKSVQHLSMQFKEIVGCVLQEIFSKHLPVYIEI